MTRRDEAVLARQNMSMYKTLYVEGDLDLNLINAYLTNSKIENIRIYRIEADKNEIDFQSYMCQDNMGAKKKIIEFIKHSNEDVTIEKGKYLGIVDLDFDICFNEKEDVDNLLYTDLNSMESYLIDLDLFKTFALDYKVDSLTYFEEKLEIFMENFIEFNICFLAQVRHYDEFDGNLISFDRVPLNCSPFIKSECDYEICLDSLKQKVNGSKEVWESLYIQKKGELGRLVMECREKLLYFLHGKYLLKYLIGICKNHYRNIKSLSEDMIINSLKDKFIIALKYEQYDLFLKINSFSKTKII